MGLRRHLRDFSGTSLASFLATACDAALYALLVLSAVRAEVIGVGIAAGVGAVVGGIIHYGLCRFWVFRRFGASIPSSVLLYMAMSWIAAVGHGALTHWLSGSAGVVIGWLISKAILWLLWTYPLSRYVVFYKTPSDPGRADESSAALLPSCHKD